MISIIFLKNIFVIGNRKLHTTPTGQDFAFAHEPLAGESFFDANGGDSIAEVYDGEGPVSHSRGTPGKPETDSNDRTVLKILVIG